MKKKPKIAAIVVLAAFAGFILAIGTDSAAETWLNGTNYIYPNINYSNNVNVTGYLFVDKNTTMNNQMIINFQNEKQAIILQNNATYWTDVAVPGLTVAVGVLAPGLVNWNNTLAQLWCYAGTVRNEYASGTMELPHSWKEGSTVSPHVHSGKSTSGSGNYTLNIDGIFMNATNGASIHYKSNITVSTGIIWQDIITDFDEVQLTGFTTGSTFTFRITRLQDAATDNYVDCVGIKQISLHFESDTLGSASEYNKWS